MQNIDTKIKNILKIHEIIKENFGKGSVILLTTGERSEFSGGFFVEDEISESSKITEPQKIPEISSVEEIKNKVHFISVTGIIRNAQGKYLICKRSPTESAFPNKWCVPGGKIELTDFINSPKDTKDHWLNIFERILEKEVMEETGLKIKNIGYVSSLAFMRKNGYSTIIVSLYCEHAGGNVILQKEELVDHAGVTLEEAKNYDLIENIYEQIEVVESKYKNK